jgi:AcrR family transcriptional regulator
VPRAGLNRERVVDEAIAVADAVGFDRLSLAAVAERTGVRLPSLYKHIESLDGLRRDVAVRALEELADAVAPAVDGGTGADGLRAMAAAYRDYARTHPGRYAATVRAPLPGDERHAAAAEAILRVVYAVLAGYRLDADDATDTDDAVDAARTLRAALHGFVVLEASGGFGLPRDVDRSFDRLVAALDTALTDWPSSGPERTPPPQRHG